MSQIARLPDEGGITRLDIELAGKREAIAAKLS